MAPEPDDDDDETWVLFNAMNGNRAEMSPEAAGIAACLMTYSHHACRCKMASESIMVWHLNRSRFGIRIDHDLASISDHSLASQSITIWHASDH